MIGLTILGFFILCFRNFEPLVFPTIYAEDGTWLAEIIRDGWLSAAFSVRDFPVVGLVGLQRLAVVIVDIFFSHDLSKLPYAYFILSNLFVALIASLSFYIFRSRISLEARLLLFLTVLLMPVGADGNEIFGRILNLGFIFPVLHYLVLANVLETNSGRLSFVFSCVLSFVATLTFPVSLAFNVIAATFLFYRSIWYSRIASKGDRSKAVALLCVTAVSLLLIPLSAFTGKGGANLPYSPAGLVEFAFARPLLYPFLSSVYSRLNDVITLLLVLTFAIVFGRVTSSLLRNGQREALQRGLFILACFATYYFATLVMRRGFTSAFGTYQSSFPDRYFYGLNVLFVFLVVQLVDAYTFSMQRLRLTILSVIVICFLSFAVKTKLVFEMGNPKTAWREFGTFGASLCAYINESKLRFERDYPDATREGVVVPPIVANTILRIQLPEDRVRMSTSHCKT